MKRFTLRQRVCLAVAFLLACFAAGILSNSSHDDVAVDGHFDSAAAAPSGDQTQSSSPSPTASQAPALPSTESTSDQSEPTQQQEQPTNSQAAAPSKEPSLIAPRQCDTNVQGVIIPTLDVSAKTVSIGLDSNGVLEAPSHADRQFVGVYDEGPRPGDPGNVQLDGHTYVDGSAVFDDSFGTTLKVGDSIELVTSNCTYTYRVDQMWPTLAKAAKDASPSAPLFADVAQSEQFFRADGPSGLVLMTCSGEFDQSIRHHLSEAVAHATLVSIS